MSKCHVGRGNNKFFSHDYSAVSQHCRISKPYESSCCDLVRVFLHVL